MAKKNWLEIMVWVSAVLVSLAVGGTFYDGGYMNTTILKLLPLVFHQIVGGFIIIGTILGAFMKLFK